MVRSSFFVALVVSLLSVPPVRGQQPSFSRANGKVIGLGDGRFAAIKSGPDGAVVDGLIDGDRAAGPLVDLRVGDIIIRFQELSSPTADQIALAFDGAAIGAEIALVVRRGGAERTVTFRRSAGPSGSRIAISAPDGGTGAWVTGESGAAADFSIAGVRLRENTDGLPEVTHRTSHPAGAIVPLRVGDVIVTFNGRAISALAGLEKWYAETPVGGEIVLAVTRAGRTTTVTFAKPADR